MTKYVANVKHNGRVHRVIDSDGLRVHCGWQIKKSVSMVFECYRIRYGQLCQRCFPIAEVKPSNDEDIEQFDSI